MEIQHKSHPHPLVFHQDKSNQSDEDTFRCLGCEGEVSGPCFSCAECEFYLHKKCAEAPVEIVHPFHPNHPLILRPPSQHDEEKTCSVCGKKGKGYVYHCSFDGTNLDINCALLPRDTAGNFIQTLHVAHCHPLNLIANDNNHLEDRACENCSSKLVGASYACFKCSIFFHKKCVEPPIQTPTQLPTEIDHPYHRKHQLILHFEENYCLCNLCECHHQGYFYRCSLCNVDIYCACDRVPPIVEDKNHEHPFTLQFRPNSFTCDACGTQGNNVSYICSACNLQVHRNCISLPCIIRISLHHHPIYRKFFLRFHPRDSKTWDCKICYQEVNLEYGSYYCSKPDCNFIVHVKCGTEFIVSELENQDEVEEYNKEIAQLYGKPMDCITRVIKEINIGKDVIAAEIEHISHGHNLTFSTEIVDGKYCDGCVLPILSSFYYCSQCDFFLHKACAEFQRKTLLWFLRRPLTLYTKSLFFCLFCHYFCNGFIYKVDGDIDAGICLRCSAVPHSFTYQSDKAHHLFLDGKHEGQCSACGRKKFVFYRSKDYDLALDFRCLTLPRVAWHKSDKHSLRLAYGDSNDYSLQHYCDICEERRDPKLWFYQCEDCNTAAHPKCVLGKYPFVKRGGNLTSENFPHPVTFVQNINNYPQCVRCGKPCQDLSIESVVDGRNIALHFKCALPNFRDDYSDSE